MHQKADSMLHIPKWPGYMLKGVSEAVMRKHKYTAKQFQENEIVLNITVPLP